MIFWILTPVPPRTGVPFFRGGWGVGGGGLGGGQNFFVYCGRCVCIWTWVLKNFFLVPPPPCPTNTVSNEHYPFEPYFLCT